MPMHDEKIQQPAERPFRRLALYVFWEKDGNVREYVFYYLQNLQAVTDTVLLIANGRLSRDSRKRLEAMSVGVLLRDNKGFDFFAWKDGLEHTGWDQLTGYDEIILCNSSCYGPIYPFSCIFDSMKKRQCDFWGLYLHPEKAGTFPAHLQSYFLVLRKSLTQTEDFFSYWQSLKPAASWEQAVDQETAFTQYFEEKGFHASSYLEGWKYRELVGNPTVLLPQLLLEEKFPLLKRKVFTESYRVFHEISNTSQGKETLAFLKKHTDYPVQYIYEDLCRSLPASSARKILHLTFALSEAEHDSPMEGENVAFIVFSYFEDLVEECIRYLRSVPAGADIYIVVVSERMRECWERKTSAFPGRHMEVRVQQNRGRNESAYWLTCRDVVEKYEFICVAHDKKTPSANARIKGYYFSRHCWDNILKTEGYVLRVLDLFREEPYLGILMPPLPLFSDWSTAVVGREWGKNREIAGELYRRLQLHVPFDDSPDGVYGSMFWFRSRAMLPLYRYAWSWEDFPEEPLAANDGTLLHALERLYPMIAQEAGYLSGWIMPVSETGVHYDNLYDCLKETRAVLDGRNVAGTHFSTVKNIISAYLKKKIRKTK